MSLDVGCGGFKRGVVGVDKSRFSREVGFQRSFVKTKADVVGVGECLPFCDNLFDVVYSYHVIEHCFQPYMFLSELIRVCKVGGMVVLRCPHRFGCHAKMRFHRNFFGRDWFCKALSCYSNINWDVDVVGWWSPLANLLLLFPNEIQVRVNKFC